MLPVEGLLGPDGVLLLLSLSIGRMNRRYRQPVQREAQMEEQNWRDRPCGRSLRRSTDGELLSVVGGGDMRRAVLPLDAMAMKTEYSPKRSRRWGCGGRVEMCCRRAMWLCAGYS